MTPVADYRAQFTAALALFTAARPDARVYVVSVPDVYRLWELEHTNFAAVLIWEVASICRSLLANPLSAAPEDVARRQRVRDRVVAYNAQLADVCAQYVHCRFDGNAVFGTAFVASDVSALDHFHPSLSGQARLSAITWAAGFDFTDGTAPTSTAGVSLRPGGRSATVTFSAADDVGVSGIEYRFGRLPYRRYTGPVSLLRGRLLTYRAVDVNGNIEASRTLSLP